MSVTPAAPRRHASRGPRSRQIGTAVLALVLVVLAAAAVGLTRPATPAPATHGATASGGLVTRTVLACPDHVSGHRVRTSVRLGLVADPGAGLRVGGSVERGAVAGKGSSVDLSRGPLVDVPSAGGPTVHAVGPSAAGLFGFRTDRRASSGLALTSCGEPRAQWWFTGAGAGLDHSSTLLLSNVDPGPAVVDLRVLGPAGEVDTAATHGIVLAPSSHKRIDLTDIAPQTDDLALSVHAERGRVVAAVDDSFDTGPSAVPGQEWLPSTERPSRTPTLAGIPVGAKSRTLLVANPSDLETTVDLRVSGRSGTFTPTGLGTITVSPGSIRHLDLSRTVPAGQAAALRLRSRVPVVASVRSVQKGDQSYAAPVEPLAGPAAAPLVAGAPATVQLSAGAHATRVRVAAYDDRGRRVDGTTVSVDAAATRSWSPRKGAAYLVVTPSRRRGTGSVSGAVTYAGGGLAAVPLTAVPLREQRPSVQPGLR